MDDQRKTSIMISGRLPPDLVERVDYVTRNTEHPQITNRSAAMRAAFEKWLPDLENEIQGRLGGASAKKANR